MGFRSCIVFLIEVVSVWNGSRNGSVLKFVCVASDGVHLFSLLALVLVFDGVMSMFPAGMTTASFIILWNRHNLCFCLLLSNDSYPRLSMSKVTLSDLP